MRSSVPFTANLKGVDFTYAPVVSTSITVISCVPADRIKASSNGVPIACVTFFPSAQAFHMR